MWPRDRGVRQRKLASEFVCLLFSMLKLVSQIIAFPANIFKIYKGNKVFSYMVQYVKPCLFACTQTSP